MRDMAHRILYQAHVIWRTSRLKNLSFNCLGIFSAEIITNDIKYKRIKRHFIYFITYSIKFYFSRVRERSTGEREMACQPCVRHYIHEAPYVINYAGATITRRNRSWKANIGQDINLSSKKKFGGKQWRRRRSPKRGGRDFEDRANVGRTGRRERDANTDPLCICSHVCVHVCAYVCGLVCVEGKSEGRGLTGREGRRTARSVGANFHFFHLFAPLATLLKKRHGGTGARLVDFRPVYSLIGSPFPLRPSQGSLYLIPSETSLPLAPSLLSSYLTSLSCRPVRSFLLARRGSSLLLSALSPPERTISLSSDPSDTSGHGRSPYVTDTIPLE